MGYDFFSVSAEIACCSALGVWGGGGGGGLEYRPCFSPLLTCVVSPHRDLKHNLISTIVPGAFAGLSELRKL